MPLEVSRSVWNAICFQASLDLQEACSLQVLTVDAADNLSLLRVDDQVAFLVLGVAQEPVMIDLHLALLIAVLDAHSHVG